MLIRLTKLTNDLHRFEIVRDDGARESRDLDTRSYLIHDLVHYAVESEAKLTSSFYGLLADRRAYGDLLNAPPVNNEALQTEFVVGPIQTALRDPDWITRDPRALADRLIEAARNMGAEPPAWLSGDLIARVRERLRQVMGQWRATPFHQTMELTFTPRG